MSEIWVINRGSSSLKLARYDADSGECLARTNQGADAPLPTGNPLAIGHRVVHGGTEFCEPVEVNESVLARLEALVELAPLHQPHNLAAIRALSDKGVPQFACFDTAFHHTVPPVMTRLPLSPRLTEEGVQNYGFHGLSYQFIASQLGAKSGRWVVLHLGSGASACALHDGVSVGTSMGFSALDGLIMGTRCGRLDPGVVLHWWGQGLSHQEMQTQLYQHSGLMGLAGDSDMRACWLVTIGRPRGPWINSA